MGFRRIGISLALASAALAANASAQAVKVTPQNPAVAAGGTVAFSANDPTAIWLVNGIRYGAPLIGTIGGSLYTAPIDVPSATQVPVEAASTAYPKHSGTATVGIAASTASGSIFQVATTGSDSTGDGSAGSPWLTIQHAVTSVPAGSTIQVHAGTYNEIVTITTVGTAATGFLSIEAYPGDAPIVDGTGLSVPQGEYGLFTISDASYVRVSGFEIRNYTSNSAASVPVGIYVIGSGDEIEIRNNHIHDIVTTVTTSAGDALGIAVYGTEAPAPIKNLVIDGNELDSLQTGFSESLAVSGNVKFWQVTNNLIHDNNNIGIDIAGFEEEAPQVAYDQARKGLVQGNTVYNISSVANPAYDGQYGADGIYVDGGADITIQQNLVHDTDIGIEIASEHFGHKATGVIARDNVVYHSNVVGMSIGGYGASVGGTADCVIVNNTLYDDDTTNSGSGEFQIQFHAHGNVFKNNILYAGAQGLLVNAFVAGAEPPAAMNQNLYFTDAGAADAQFVWRGTTYTGLAAYQAGAGTDGKSLYGDPLFVDIGTTPDLDVGTGSPALGAGKDLGLVDLGLYDNEGNPRLSGTSVDIGAYQD